MARVGWIGLGKLGLPCALVLAQHHGVSGYDVSDRPWDILHGRVAPLREEGIGKLLADPDVRIARCDDVSGVVERSDVIFVAVQTPHSPEFGGELPVEQAPEDFEYSFLVQACRSVAVAAEAQQKSVTLVVVSTVLPGTTDRLIRPLLNGYVDLIYSPQFIAMGTTIADFRNPEFVICGCDPDDPGRVVSLREVFLPVHGEDRIFPSDIVTAESIKVFYNCYSDDTEVMTSQGWKLFADLTGEEQVLSLNPENHFAEWVSHRPVPGQDGHTELVRFWSSKDDILVTPGHNMFAGSQRSGPGPLPCDGQSYSWKFELVPAEVLEGRKHFTFTRSVQWLGQADSEEVTVASHRVPDLTFARFMGWYLAEGCVSQHSRQSWSVTVSQSRRASSDNWLACRKAVSEMCDVFGVAFSENDMGFTFYHKHLAMYLAEFGHAAQKYVPEVIKEAHCTVIRAFMDAYLAGDGCVGPPAYYATTSLRMSSDLGELIVKLGHMPSYRTVLSPISGRECYLVYETISRTSTRRHVDRVAYSGKVYCTRLDRNHVMLTRRNGKCTWQGNTYISMKIVWANHVMELCQKTGADCDTVIDALSRADDRVVSAKYMRGGMGDGGACHPRDLIALSWLEDRLEASVSLFRTLAQMREQQTEWLARQVRHYARLTGLGVSILGISYKPRSDLTAGSPALLLAHYLADLNPVQGDNYVTVGSATIGASPLVYVLATKHPEYVHAKFPVGSVVLDPFGYIPDRKGVTVVRVGRR